MLPWASFPVSGHNKDRIYSRVPAQPAPSQLLLRAPLICSGVTGFQLILPWRAIVVTGLSLGIEPLECLSGWSPLAIKGNRFPRAGRGGRKPAKRCDFQRGFCRCFSLEAGLARMPGSRPPPPALHWGTDCLSSGGVLCASCHAVRGGD